MLPVSQLDIDDVGEHFTEPLQNLRASTRSSATSIVADTKISACAPRDGQSASCVGQAPASHAPQLVP